MMAIRYSRDVLLSTNDLVCALGCAVKESVLTMGDAWFPEPVCGAGLIHGSPADYFEEAVVIAAPEAWRLARPLFPIEPLKVVVPRSMEQSDIEHLIDALPQFDTVFGIGGGSACDAAKLCKARKGGRLVLIPSALSVDAAFCRSVAVRQRSRVRYIGSVEPDRLLVDMDLIRAAPPYLNRAGVGDIVSIYTAAEDWKIAHADRGEAFDADICSRSEMLLTRLHAAASDIADGAESGLYTLAQLYVEEVRLCETWGDSRPEEGSEHYFAYCLESLTRRAYIHGELVCLGAILAALAQQRPIDELLRLLSDSKVSCSPRHLGLTPESLTETLLSLPAFLAEERHLPYGVYHRVGMTESLAKRLTDAVFDLFDGGDATGDATPDASPADLNCPLNC